MTSLDKSVDDWGKSRPNVSADLTDQSLLAADLAGVLDVSGVLELDEESEDAGVAGVVEVVPESLDVLDEEADSLDVVLDDDFDLPPRLSVL
jgi:hypothetical protein